MENHQSGNARISASAQSSLACSSFTSAVSVPLANAAPEAAGTLMHPLIPLQLHRGKRIAWTAWSLRQGSGQLA